MSARTVHVVGAGLAGLAAAVSLAGAGERVVLHEAARQAGGRCRSYFDATLGLEIDNGNHLLLTGNTSAMAYVDEIGGRSALTIADEAEFDFADLGTGERWRLRPNRGRLPWWLLMRDRRVPGTGPLDYLGPLGILRAKPGQTIGEVMTCRGLLYDRLWRPLLLAALNTEPPESAASLAAPVLRETLGAGGAACRPVIAAQGLSAAFVDPALAFLRARGAEFRTGSRLRSLRVENGAVAGLAMADGDLALAAEDRIVLAVPPWVASDLIPGLRTVTEYRGILNAHFKVTPPPGSPLLLGMIGSVTEWLFAYPDRLSVTISGADRLFDTPREEMARIIWDEIVRATGLATEGPGLPAEMPVWQIVKEKRATFAATPDQAGRRPGPRSAYPNLILAGDWTDTGLPATIEGAIRSGKIAASLLQSGDGQDRPPV